MKESLGKYEEEVKSLTHMNKIKDRGRSGLDRMSLIDSIVLSESGGQPDEAWYGQQSTELIMNLREMILDGVILC